MKIYVASSWRNGYQQSVVSLLRSLGHAVYDFKNPSGGKGFAWSDIDPDWEKWSTADYVNALRSRQAVTGYKLDFSAMHWADCCVMVLPCGRSANIEAGWMKGAGKLLYIYSPVKQEPELMYKMSDEIIADEMDLRYKFSFIHPAICDCKVITV